MPAAALAGGGLVAGGQVAVGFSDDAELEGDAVGGAAEGALPGLGACFEWAGCGWGGGSGLGWFAGEGFPGVEHVDLRFS